MININRSIRWFSLVSIKWSMIPTELSQTNDETQRVQRLKCYPRKENQIAVVDDVFLLSLLFNNVVHAMDSRVGNVQTSDCSKPIKFIETSTLLVSGIRKEETSWMVPAGQRGSCTWCVDWNHWIHVQCAVSRKHKELYSYHMIDTGLYSTIVAEPKPSSMIRFKRKSEPFKSSKFKLLMIE